MTTTSALSVNIRPGVSVLSVLSHLNYKPWYAMAEFVDNALQSFLDHRDELEGAAGLRTKLQVSIGVDLADGGRITIRDNAAGIYLTDYERAFRTAAIPPSQDGLSEFGMGMKSAACWFARKWTVRTCALGEGVERTISFDIDAIVRDGREELPVVSEPRHRGAHYTEITLADLHKPPYGRTIGKIKEHLASIYRMFIREGVLELRFDGEVLTYETAKVLCAPYFKDPEGAVVREWRKEIDLDLGMGMRARGFAALRETASTATAGFALFRRSRLIEGSADEGYRPAMIFGRSNSYIYQRLFGELELHGFEVSHTKDGFRWGEHEEPFLELLKEVLNAAPLPMLWQAEGFRVRPRPEVLRRAAESAATTTADVIRREVPPVIEELETLPGSEEPPPALPVVTTASRRVIDVTLDGRPWEIVLELTDDPSVGEWVELFDERAPTMPSDLAALRRVGVRLSLGHPFMQRFGGTSAEEIEPLLRVAAAIGLAETAARDSGVRYASTIRRNINALLLDALSKP
jgi:hypothetical protein